MTSKNYFKSLIAAGTLVGLAASNNSYAAGCVRDYSSTKPKTNTSAQVNSPAVSLASTASTSAIPIKASNKFEYGAGIGYAQGNEAGIFHADGYIESRKGVTIVPVLALSTKGDAGAAICANSKVKSLEAEVGIGVLGDVSGAIAGIAKKLQAKSLKNTDFRLKGGAYILNGEVEEDFGAYLGAELVWNPKGNFFISADVLATTSPGIIAGISAKYKFGSGKANMAYAGTNPLLILGNVKRKSNGTDETSNQEQTETQSQERSEEDNGDDGGDDGGITGGEQSGPGGQ